METPGEGTNPGVALYSPPRTTATSPGRGGKNDINSPTHFSQIVARRMQTDICFNCRNQGHWANSCPLKTPKKASIPEDDIQFLPVMRCYCGVAYGISERSGRRKYYSRCRCSDVEANRGDLWCSDFKAPMCKCGAGPCTINMGKYENGEPIIYYTCRIRTGHGSCGFLHFLTAPSSPIVRRCIQKDRQPSVLSSKHNGTPNTITHEGECSDRDIDTLEVERCDPVRGKQLTVSRLMSRSDIHLCQKEFWNQISDTDDSGDECRYDAGASRQLEPQTPPTFERNLHINSPVSLNSNSFSFAEFSDCLLQEHIELPLLKEVSENRIQKLMLQPMTEDQKLNSGNSDLVYISNTQMKFEVASSQTAVQGQQAESARAKDPVVELGPTFQAQSAQAQEEGDLGPIPLAETQPGLKSSFPSPNPVSAMCNQSKQLDDQGPACLKFHQPVPASWFQDFASGSLADSKSSATLKTGSPPTVPTSKKHLSSSYWTST